MKSSCTSFISSHFLFPVGEGIKKFEDQAGQGRVGGGGRGVKKFQDWGELPIWGIFACWGVSTPLYTMHIESSDPLPYGLSNKKFSSEITNFINPFLIVANNIQLCIECTQYLVTNFTSRVFIINFAEISSVTASYMFTKLIMNPFALDVT